MAFDLTLANGEPLQFQPGLPTDYRGPVLHGSVAASAKTNIAHIVVQELTGEYYSIRLTVARFFKRVTAIGKISTPGLYSYFMLKNGLRKEVNTIGKLHLRQDQYSCFYTEPATCNIKLEKDIEYVGIDLFYSPKLLEELLPFFPELKEVLLSSSAIMPPGKACWTLPAMKEITHQILNCPYNEDTRQFYFDLKVRELLFQMLENAYKKNKKKYSFTPWEAARIHEARTILGNHISTKPPSIRSLSKQVALNEFKLKTGFQQYFSTGMFDWLMEEKMQHAKQLLLATNKPIKDICSLVGYPRTTNFITAFKRRFGMTPGSLRHQ